MSRFTPGGRVVLSVLAGALAGFFALHPYTMLVFGIFDMRHPVADEGVSGLAHLLGTFSPGMLRMGMPYAVLGGVAGLFFGMWMNAEKSRVEAEKRALALDTLKQLMVTLSHYLLNASTVIGGYASRIMKVEKDEDIKTRLAVIKKEAECVETVVKSLQAVQAVETERYIPDSETMLIDITRQIEEHLREHTSHVEATKEAV